MGSIWPGGRERGEGGRGPGLMKAREWRYPGPSSLREMNTQKIQYPEDDGKRRITWGGRQDTRETEGPAAGEPPGDERNLGAGRGRKQGGEKLGIWRKP